MMTLDEAIIHAEKIADKCAVTDGDRKCEAEHRQLAEWLKELRQYRDIFDSPEEAAHVVTTMCMMQEVVKQDETRRW